MKETPNVKMVAYLLVTSRPSRPLVAARGGDVARGERRPVPRWYVIYVGAVRWRGGGAKGRGGLVPDRSLSPVAVARRTPMHATQQVAWCSGQWSVVQGAV